MRIICLQMIYILLHTVRLQIQRHCSSIARVESNCFAFLLPGVVHSLQVASSIPSMDLLDDSFRVWYLFLHFNVNFLFFYTLYFYKNKSTLFRLLNPLRWQLVRGP